MSRLTKWVIATFIVVGIFLAGLTTYVVYKSSQEIYIGFVLSEQGSDNEFAASTQFAIDLWNQENEQELITTTYVPANKTKMSDQFQTAVSSNDIIITTSSYDEFIQDAATNNPNKEFIVFNGSVQGLTNVNNIYVNTSTDSYLLGAYAASMNKEGVVYIGSDQMPTSLQERITYPFVAGVYDTDPTTELSYINYSSTLSEDDKTRLIEEAAKEGDVIVIGATVYTDEILTIASELELDDDVIFVTMSGTDYATVVPNVNIGASQIFNFTEAITAQLNEIILNDSGSEFSKYPKYYIIDEETALLLNQITTEVKNGVNSIPSNQEEYDLYLKDHETIKIIK